MILERGQGQAVIVALADHGAVRRDERDAIPGLLGDAMDPLLRGGGIGREPLADDLGFASELRRRPRCSRSRRSATSAVHSSTRTLTTSTRSVPATTRPAKVTTRGPIGRRPGSDIRIREPSRSCGRDSPSLVRSRWTCMSTVRVWMSGCASQTVSSRCGRVCTRPRRSTSVRSSLYSVAVRSSSRPFDGGPERRPVDRDVAGRQRVAARPPRAPRAAAARRRPGASVPPGRRAW